MPSHTTGFGVCVGPVPTSTALTERPHASVMFAGAPGSTASAGHDTVDDGDVGAVSPPL